MTRNNDTDITRSLDGLRRFNDEAARLRNGKRYVDMTPAEKATYNRRVHEMSRFVLPGRTASPGS